MNMNKGEKIKLPHLVAEILENKLIENYRPLSKQLSQLGIKAWKNARDATDFTPEDYARKRDHISYIQMVQSKIDSRLPNADVSVAMISTDITVKHASQLKSTDQATFDVQKSQQSDKRPLSCRQCVQHLAYRPHSNRFLSNRPAVLSLLAIAAVCVCVGLIMRSALRVSGMTGPFVWNSLLSGPE